MNDKEFLVELITGMTLTHITCDYSHLKDSKQDVMSFINHTLSNNENLPLEQHYRNKRLKEVIKYAKN